MARLAGDRSRHSIPDLRSWQARALQIMEESHLVAWSSAAPPRDGFLGSLAVALSRLTDTQVCILRGKLIEDLYSFCAQLENVLDCGRVRRALDGPSGVLASLRSRPVHSGPRPTKRRFILWDDADLLLKKDPELFGRLIDAIVGVAAELEYTSEDLLLIQRAIFIGGPALDIYADNPRGQFRAWLNGGHNGKHNGTHAGDPAASGHAAPPLWRTVTGLDKPKFFRFAIPDEAAAVEA